LLGAVTNGGGERTNFFCAGVYWQWYYDGSGNGLGYRTSEDGINWSSITYVSPTNVLTPTNWSLYFDGVYVHYAVGSIYYRRGIPQNNGTIAWSASEQKAASGGSNICVCVDTYGYPVISYIGTGSDGYGHALVIKSSANDGTWATKSGYPLQSLQITAHKTLLVQLTGGKIMLLYFPTYSTYGGLDSEILVNDVLSNFQIITMQLTNLAGGFSAVAVGDDVHVVVNAGASLYTYYFKFTYSALSWSSGIVLWKPSAIPYRPSISSLGVGNLAVFVANKDNCLYCIRYLNDAWDASLSKLVDETGEVLTGYLEVSSSEKTYAGKALLAWLGKSSSPYDIRFIQVALA
jgi:hypothetical protein